jgi:hypothetical protein
MQTAISSPSNGWVLTYNGVSGKWEAQAATGGVTDHGALTGLADDDHAQYVLASGARDITGNQSVVSNSDSVSFGFLLKRSRGSAGSKSIVSNGDVIFGLVWQGYDGASYITSSMIRGYVDGTPGLNNMPGRLTFWTVPDGSNNPLERVRIDRVGFMSMQSGSIGRASPVTKTVSFTVATTENWLICNGAGTITVTLPAASSFPGREIMIKTIAAQAVNSASSNVMPLAGGAAGTTILSATAGKWATLVSDGSNWIIMQAGG